MSIWVLPAGSNDVGGAGDGDLLVRAEGEDVHVARIVGDAVEWLGGAPVDDTIVLPDVAQPTLADSDLEAQLEGFVTALQARGG